MSTNAPASSATLRRGLHHLLVAAFILAAVTLLAAPAAAGAKVPRSHLREYRQQVQLATGRFVTTEMDFNAWKGIIDGFHADLQRLLGSTDPNDLALARQEEQLCTTQGDSLGQEVPGFRTAYAKDLKDFDRRVRPWLKKAADRRTLTSAEKDLRFAFWLLTDACDGLDEPSLRNACYELESAETDGMAGYATVMDGAAGRAAMAREEFDAAVKDLEGLE